MTDWNEQATSEVVDLLRVEGFDIESWELLAHSNRLVLGLKPIGLVARIARCEMAKQMAHELEVAAHVVASSGPAAPPVAGGSVRLTENAVFSLWERVTLSGRPSPKVLCVAYAALRASLDSFHERLPDFREAIVGASRLAHESSMPCLSSEEVALLRSTLTSGLSSLSSYRWSPRALHGDPHGANVALTPVGPRWFDFEAVCTGPIEWDLSALRSCMRRFTHDPALLRTLISLRRACVVAWCAVRPAPRPPELEAIRYHLGELEAAGAVR